MLVEDKLHFDHVKEAVDFINHLKLNNPAFISFEIKLPEKHDDGIDLIIKWEV